MSEPTPPPAVAAWLSQPHRVARKNLTAAAEAHQDTTRWLASSVAIAKRAGLSWAAVGEIVGMTGEGARKRWQQVV